MYSCLYVNKKNTVFTTLGITLHILTKTYVHCELTKIMRLCQGNPHIEHKPKTTTCKPLYLKWQTL